MISKSMELWYIPIFNTKTKTEKARKKQIEINIVGEGQRQKNLVPLDHPPTLTQTFFIIYP